ncbi:odorant receptor 56a [Glossina fuscipes]|uniref:Odorant receptor n=1 Tax=Glossina fuscipes TaxID=7396 RepID=A0A9C6DWZ1_9MUSC|nr:odorant receptor 56a [Glossina fuscipes]
MVDIKDLQIHPEVFENPLIIIHLKSMLLYGLIVSTEQKHKRFSLRRGAVFTISFVISCALIFIKVSRGFESLAAGATSCATAFLYLSTSITIVNAFFQRARVVRMCTFLHEDINKLMELADEREKKMFADTVKYLRYVTVILWTPSVLAGFIAYADCFYRTIFMPETVFNIPQVLRGEAEPILLFQLFPFGEVYDNFLIGYLGACYALFLGITTIPCWHTFITCLMKYIVLKFQIINKRLKEMDISKLSPNFSLQLDMIDNLNENDLNYWRLKMCEFCVKEQTKIKWFANEIQALIRIPVFLDFIIFSVLICFLFYALTTDNPSKMDYFFMLIYLFVMASILWLYHWHATLIAQCNDDLGFAIYSSNWYDYPLIVQKSIRLIMMDSTKPLTMKAFLVELNLKTFIDVVRGAYSYFSILRNANLD